MTGGNPTVLSIKKWMEMVKKGEVQVPEFQRNYVWDCKRVMGLIEAILKGRPIGSLLGLEVNAEKEEVPFKPRSIDCAPESKLESCRFLVLDGQQRLTALWHALMNADNKHCYFIEYDEKNPSASPVGRAERRPVNNKTTWINDNKKCVKKGYIPVHLLAENPENVRNWINDAYKNEQGMVNPDKTVMLQDWIKKMRNQILNFKIPYLSLPEKISEADAIDAFIESNTSAQKLRKFDLTVATMRRTLKDKDNLRGLRDETGEKIPVILKYINEDELGDLLLKIACLRQDIPPTEGNYGRKEVLEDIQENIQNIRTGIDWTCNFLRSDSIFSAKFLPSRVPLRVLPALHGALPSNERDRDSCRKLTRKYLWRAFFTSRYTSDAAHLLLSDYRGLRDAFKNNARKPKVDILNEDDYSLPTAEQLKETPGWPTRQGTLPRAILTLFLIKGARDICSNETINYNNIEGAEAHHIFPIKYLEEKADIDNDSNNPLNCMLISRRANRRARSKPPLEYLSDLYSMDLRAEIGKPDIQSRLESHLIPAKLLLRENVKDVKQHYKAFLRERAKLIEPSITALANGEDP